MRSGSSGWVELMDPSPNEDKSPTGQILRFANLTEAAIVDVRGRPREPARRTADLLCEMDRECVINYADRIEELLTTPPVVLIISGFRGSGKTTLTDQVLGRFPESIRVRLDNFLIDRGRGDGVIDGYDSEPLPSRSYGGSRRANDFTTSATTGARTG